MKRRTLSKKEPEGLQFVKQQPVIGIGGTSISDVYVDTHGKYTVIVTKDDRDLYGALHANIRCKDNHKLSWKEKFDIKNALFGEGQRMIKKEVVCDGDCDNFDDENDNCFDYRDDECVDPRELKCFGMSKRKYDLMSLRKLATQLLFDEAQLLPEFNADIVKKTKEVLDSIVDYIHLENNEETEND